MYVICAQYDEANDVNSYSPWKYYDSYGNDHLDYVCPLAAHWQEQNDEVDPMYADFDQDSELRVQDFKIGF